jgi:hypothetical protein
MRAISTRIFGCILDRIYDTMYTLSRGDRVAGNATSESVLVTGSESRPKRC